MCFRNVASFMQGGLHSSWRQSQELKPQQYIACWGARAEYCLMCCVGLHEVVHSIARYPLVCEMQSARPRHKGIGVKRR